jgi:hypothetical protein
VKPLALALALFLTACAPVLSNLPTVIAAVQDGVMVIDTISRFVEAWMARNPGKVDEAKIRGTIERARGALNVALRTAQGTQKLDQAQVDAAFSDFKQAYIELLALVAPLGVQTGDKLMARPDTISVPEPMALKIKVN